MISKSSLSGLKEVAADEEDIGESCTDFGENARGIFSVDTKEVKNLYPRKERKNERAYMTVKWPSEQPSCAALQHAAAACPTCRGRSRGRMR